MIFEYSPYNLYALIEDNSILISWEFDTNLQNSFIEGFKIYYGESDPVNIGTTQDTYFEKGYRESYKTQLDFYAYLMQGMEI